MREPIGVDPAAPCPPSSVADQIVRAPEVQPGDLTLWVNELRYVEESRPGVTSDGWILRFYGETELRVVPVSGYVAVRRYVEEPSPAMAIRAARLLLTEKGILPEVHVAFGDPLRPWCGNPEGFGPGGHTTYVMATTCKGCVGFTEEELAKYDRWGREGLPPGYRTYKPVRTSTGYEFVEHIHG